MKKIILLLLITISAHSKGIKFDPHNDIYWLSGYEQSETKLQISFKKEFFPIGFYFGYTGTFFWDLLKESSPFRNYDHKPELFQRLSFGKNFIDIGAFEHQSNGRDLSANRSVNRSYVRSVFGFASTLFLAANHGYENLLELNDRSWKYRIGLMIVNN